MNTFKMNKVNAEKVIARMSARRTINTAKAWEIFEKYYEGKEIAAPSMSAVCDQFAASIWNKAM
jgi:hypothetical protein